jgi:dihydropteroate synthase
VRIECPRNISGRPAAGQQGGHLKVPPRAASVAGVRDVVTFFSMPDHSPWHVRGRALSLERPLVMGILNITPDSFSDGGRFLSPAAAVAHASAMLAAGADIIDIGGESTRPDARPVSEREELGRVVPVVRAIVAEHPTAVLSIDTVKAGVAAAALDAGVLVVNDVSGLRLDPAMASVCAERRAGVVIMHSRGSVADMATYAHAEYDGDVLEIVVAELGAQVQRARDAGISAECIAIDPGIGFSKRPAQSLRMLGCLERLAQWGYPVVVGASRKRFIGEVSGAVKPSERVFGSVGAAVAAYDRGARIFRVHDVAPSRQALDAAAAIHGAGVA